MSDTSAAVPSSGGDASAPSSTGDTSGSQAASVPAGNAPGGDGDAGVAGGATDSAAFSPAAQPYSILKRNFRDQKHAEEVLGSEIGMTRGLQRQNAELTKRVELMSQELESLRPLIAARAAQGQGQVVPGAQPSGEPKSFAKELVDGGDLDVIAQMFADPNMGPAHAMYYMAELLDKRNTSSLEQMRSEVRSEFDRAATRTQQERAVAKAIGATHKLRSDYPELDPDNQSDEAAEAQQEILKILQGLPQGAEWLAREPEEALRYAAERYRRQYGAPMFATPPGTSGSPSARAAAAAEAMGNASASALDGSGVPRQRANGQPESPIERLRRENREIQTRVAKTPSGRPLGFEAPS